MVEQDSGGVGFGVVAWTVGVYFSLGLYFGWSPTALPELGKQVGVALLLAVVLLFVVD